MSDERMATLLGWLAKIEDHRVTLTTTEKGRDVYRSQFGDVEYRSTCGRFSGVVFWDAGGWDYFDGVTIDGDFYPYEETEFYRPKVTDPYRWAIVTEGRTDRGGEP